MHIRKVSRAGDYALIQNYAALQYGAPGQKRRKKTNETKEAQAKNNLKVKAEKLQLLILANFREGQHIILRYEKEDQKCTYREAEERLSKFLRRVRREAKKNDKDFKYIAITERGKRRDVLHHHMIVEDDPVIIELIKKHWGRNILQAPMYDEGAYEKLAEYFVKTETKEENEKGRAKYHRSRNLREPDVTRQITTQKWSDEPRIPDGWELVPETFYNGTNKALGLKYQKYMVRKIKGESPKKDPQKPKNNVIKRTLHKIKKLFGGRHGP